EMDAAAERGLELLVGRGDLEATLGGDGWRAGGDLVEVLLGGNVDVRLRVGPRLELLDLGRERGELGLEIGDLAVLRGLRGGDEAGRAERGGERGGKDRVTHADFPGGMKTRRRKNRPAEAAVLSPATRPGGPLRTVQRMGRQHDDSMTVREDRRLDRIRGRPAAVTRTSCTSHVPVIFPSCNGVRSGTLPALATPGIPCTLSSRPRWPPPRCPPPSPPPPAPTTPPAPAPRSYI